MANDKKFPVVKTDSLEWVFVTRNQPDDMNELRRRYHFHPLDLRDVIPPLQRPKVVARNGYLFMILLYPIYDKKLRRVRATEVDFFISPTRLVTVNVDGYEPLKDLFESCRSNSSERGTCLAGDMSQLMYAILGDALHSVFPMLVHINNDLDAIEKKLFTQYEKNLIQELLRIKTNIVNVRKAMQAHRHVIQHLTEAAPAYFPIHKLRDYFDELVDHTKEIWDMLGIQKDSVDALHSTNQSLIDFRINEIIKTLTIFSVIVFPLTLMAAIFGMNVQNMPIVGHPQSFWILLGLMALGCLGMLAYFKHRKWI
ncbi:MAG TPA: magnesium transporter CorA family protein [Candidatus Methylomirabilis sp.]|nr:magnesium transporter CorA family protein [Candidatus Methylomirabilis sp.]